MGRPDWARLSARISRSDSLGPVNLAAGNRSTEVSGDRDFGRAPAGIALEDVSVSYDGPEVLDRVTLSIEPGTHVALLGPSGCGKTTLLRAIAGLEPLSAGSITLGTRVVSAPGTHVAPEKRNVGMVFQDWALFPHMSVARNVGYGLPRAERDGPRVLHVLDMVGLGGLGDRQPHTLSGGQQQRVALARALATEPSVLLLDEPFSNLDTTLRVEVRTEVHRLLSELDITAVFVTHDQDEAFILGNKVAVMADGAIRQHGSPSELYSSPVDPWVARFVGEANLVEGIATGNTARTALGDIPLVATQTGAVQVLLRPEDLVIDVGDDATVELIEYYGHDTTYELSLADGSSIRARLTSAPRYERSQRVAVRFVGEPTAAWPA